MANSAVAAGSVGGGKRGQIVAASVDIFKEDTRAARGNGGAKAAAILLIMARHIIKRVVMVVTRIVCVNSGCS